MRSVLKLTCQYLIVWLILHVIIHFVQKNTTVSRKHWFNVKPFNISWRTSLFNSYFVNVTHNHAPQFWQIWFRLGTVITLCVMLVGIWIVTQSSFEILQIMFAYTPRIRAWAQLEKRNFRLLEQQQHGTLLPMIPGLTLPLDHLHYFFVALMVAALFHELGHSLCAGVFGLTIKYFGLFFTYLYPGAFISISQADLDTISPWQKIQVACAGIWHNLILYAICTGLNQANDFIWCHLGWKNLAKEEGAGVSLVRVHATSPLYTHLLPGMHILQLDDTPIKNGSSDWKTFWNMDYTLPLKQGYCTAFDLIDDDKSCCDITSDLPFGNSSNPMISCFQNIAQNEGDEIRGVCLYTIQTLASTDALRCIADTDCPGNYSCVVPYTPSLYGQRVRIFGEIESKGYVTTIFEGTLKDVLDSVQVSNLHPKYSYLPLQLPHQFSLLISVFLCASFIE
ncbi:MAG: hypothetical protein EXX96DRAFT_212104 [Benjaminiella poitrasii]|nr:MAG: hypothetical protein EXX96DRAFT_212104 [Benjaminiella poitrasii]